VLIVPDRRGFTLLEIIVSTAMMLIVSGAAYQLLITTQRLARGQTEQASLQSNVRSGSLVVINELRELSTVTGGGRDKNDILSLASSDITYRAMRGIGFICQTPTATEIRIGRYGFSGYRDPQPVRDSAYVFLEGSPETEVDDSWLPVAITNVSSSGTCSGSGGPGITLTVPNTTSLTDVAVGTPVRIYEVMELKLYRAEGKSWLGARSVSAGESIQPVVGPLTDDNGFRLEYLGNGGAPTSDLTAVKSIRVTIHGISDEALNAGGGQGMPIEEEQTTQVTLRNAFRP
jgi:prepilin-type N-terminal cleavage/methylation domain-containing protein